MPPNPRRHFRGLATLDSTTRYRAPPSWALPTPLRLFVGAVALLPLASVVCRPHCLGWSPKPSAPGSWTSRSADWDESRAGDSSNAGHGFQCPAGGYFGWLAVSHCARPPSLLAEL